MTYQSSDTTLSDWLLFVAMLLVAAAVGIGLVWLVVWMVTRVLKVAS